MQMIETMDPHPKPGEPAIEALVRMKESGLKWDEISKRLHDAGYYPADKKPSEWEMGATDYAGKYTRYCEEHGRERVRTTPAMYRRSFATGFSGALSVRLRQQREAQGQSTGTMALALVDIAKIVERAMLEFYPSMGVRSKGRALRGSIVRYDDASMARGNQAGHAASIISNAPKVGTNAPRALPR